MSERAIRTSDFPQADRLMQVGLVAAAVHDGRHADEEIERYIGLDSGGRQGRYYRLAAEILGLIRNHDNFADLTERGEEYASLNSEAARNEFLAMCIVDSPVFTEALRYIEEQGPTGEELRTWFRTFYPGAISTADRRYSTFLSYLHEAGLIDERESRNHIRRFRGGVVKKSQEDARDVRKRQKRYSVPRTASASSDLIRVDVDAQKRERANQIHWRLVDAKATFIDSRGLEPFDNQNVDLFVEDRGDLVFYEMKSVTDDCGNFQAQVRKAVSQLYEYRYVYGEPTARLCIVTNKPVGDRNHWLLDYLVRDREIAYEWTEDFSTFTCDSASSALLGRFSPNY